LAKIGTISAKPVMSNSGTKGVLSKLFYSFIDDPISIIVDVRLLSLIIDQIERKGLEKMGAFRQMFQDQRNSTILKDTHPKRYKAYISEENTYFLTALIKSARSP
jgi:hypothetical protein